MLITAHSYTLLKERHGGSMNQKERWNQFASTGKVTDYLEYRKEEQRAKGSTAGEGNRGHERNGDTYRDDYNGVPHERVR